MNNHFTDVLLGLYLFSPIFYLAFVWLHIDFFYPVRNGKKMVVVVPQHWRSLCTGWLEQ